MNQEPGNNVVSMGIDLTEFYLSVEWDILDVPATKNVELYNPEMDETKPKSEVDRENDKLLTDITFILTMRRSVSPPASSSTPSYCSCISPSPLLLPPAPQEDPVLHGEPNHPLRGHLVPHGPRVLPAGRLGGEG